MELAMNPIDFRDNQWHIRGTREIVEVRRSQDPPDERFQILVRGKLVYDNLPRHDQRVLLASLIQCAVPSELVSVASQAIDLCAQALQQQTAAARPNHEVEDPAQAIVAEIAAQAMK